MSARVVVYVWAWLLSCSHSCRIADKVERTVPRNTDAHLIRDNARAKEITGNDGVVQDERRLIVDEHPAANSLSTESGIERECSSDTKVDECGGLRADHWNRPSNPTETLD